MIFFFFETMGQKICKSNYKATNISQQERRIEGKKILGNKSAPKAFASMATKGGLRL